MTYLQIIALFVGCNRFVFGECFLVKQSIRAKIVKRLHTKALEVQMKDIFISGFADEISSNFDEQLRVVKELGMQYISLRSADGKNISEFSVEDVKSDLKPRLDQAGIKVSSLGSPIGKVGVEDEAGYQKQLSQLKTLCEICHLLECKYIRMFSFYIPVGENPDNYRDTVIEKLKAFTEIASEYDITLIHENEKDIYGDIGSRCVDIFNSVNSDHFKAVFDFANFVQCGEDPIKCWDMLQDEIVYIHIKDAVSHDKENVLCGTGEGRIPELLKRAIKEEGYKGFLTLEPHLVIFDALQSLELEDATDVIKENKYKDGASGYKAQYDAVCEILANIG